MTHLQEQDHDHDTSEVLGSYFQIAIGVALATLALEGFMIPNHFLDGGIIGVSLLIHEIFHYNLSLLLILGNLAFVILAFKKVSKEVAIRSTVAILLLAGG